MKNHENIQSGAESRPSRLARINGSLRSAMPKIVSRPEGPEKDGLPLDGKDAADIKWLYAGGDKHGVTGEDIADAVELPRMTYDDANDIRWMENQDTEEVITRMGLKPEDYRDVSAMNSEGFSSEHLVEATASPSDKKDLLALRTREKLTVDDIVNARPDMPSGPPRPQA